MNKRKKLPIGIESFEEMRKEDFYYVDKTRWIEQLLAQWGITTYQIITGYYNKVVNLKALIPFFGMGLSFTRIYSSV